jgi:hypothetical protein
MNSYYDLELLAKDRVQRRTAEANRERMATEAQRSPATATGWFVALTARFVGMRVPPTALSLKKTTP